MGGNISMVGRRQSCFVNMFRRVKKGLGAARSMVWGTFIDFNHWMRSVTTQEVRIRVLKINSIVKWTTILVLFKHELKSKLDGHHSSMVLFVCVLFYFLHYFGESLKSLNQKNHVVSQATIYCIDLCCLQCGRSINICISVSSIDNVSIQIGLQLNTN